MADIKVLTVYTAQIAAGKEYGAGTARPDENRFFAEMRPNGTDLRHIADAAETGLPFASINFAIASLLKESRLTGGFDICIAGNYRIYQPFRQHFLSNLNLRLPGVSKTEQLFNYSMIQETTGYDKKRRQVLQFMTQFCLKLLHFFQFRIEHTLTILQWC